MLKIEKEELLVKGIIIATHGQLSVGLKDAVDVVTGMGDEIDSLSLNRDDNLDDFEADFLNLVSKYKDEGSLVFVDMVGGSPYNVALKHLNSDLNYEVIAGVNMMMVVEVLTNLNTLSIEDLSLLAKETGQQSIEKYPLEEDEVYYEDDVEPVEVSHGKPGTITFARVDFRLIHGQVITKWSRVARADSIIIVDDLLYEDKEMASIYRSAAPVGVEVIVAPTEVIAYAQKNNTLPSGNVMLLFKDIKSVVESYKQGLRLEKLQLGGIPNDGTRQMVFTAVSLSEDDIELLDQVDETGTEIDLQVVPEEAGISYEQAKRKIVK